MPQPLRHAWAVFATLLIADVLLCAAWWLGIRVDPSLAESNLADLLPLVVAYALVPVIAGVAFAAGIARRAAKPEVETGTSRSLDLLARPALGAVPVALVVGVLTTVNDEGATAIAASAGVTLVAAFVALALATLVVRRASVRTLTIACAVVVATAAALLVVADLRGRSRLQAQRDEALREVAELRQQQLAAVRPVLLEPGVDANAVDTYRVLIEAQAARVKSASMPLDELPTALEAPSEPLPPRVAALLEQARADIAKLREATRARRAVWPTEYEKSFHAELPNLLGTRTLGQLAIAEGNTKASAGDVADAAALYLATLRFGSDFGEGPFIAALIGTAVERMAIDALARLVRSPRGAPALDAVDTGLARLQPALIDMALALRCERLMMAAMGPVEDAALFARTTGALQGTLALPPRLIPWNAYAAPAVDSLNSALREVESLTAASDPSAWQAAENDFLARYFADPNFLYRVLLPSPTRARLAAEESRAMAAAVRAAIGFERRRATEGRYPADPGPLPVDPLSSAGASLRYRVAEDGASYVLYSVGWDHADDGGKPTSDVVLPEAGWPAAQAASPQGAPAVPRARKP